MAYAARMIAYIMCKLCIADFETALSSSTKNNNVDGPDESGGGGLPLSAQTKLDKERWERK